MPPIQVKYVGKRATQGMGFRVAVAREQLTSNAGPNHFPKQAASLQGPESHSKWCLSRAQILTIDVQSRDRRRGGESPCENSTGSAHGSGTILNEILAPVSLRLV